MNDRLEDLLNDLAGRWPLLDHLMKLAATDLIVVVGLVLLALWFWPGPASERALNQRLVLVAGVAALLALALGALVAALHPESRPFVTDHSTRLLIHHAADSGLPSDHALASFGVAGAIVWWRRAVGIGVMVIGLLVGVARVYVGVHWPGDIAAGAVIGLVVGSLMAWTVSWWVGPQRWSSRFLPRHLIARP